MSLPKFMTLKGTKSVPVEEVVETPGVVVPVPVGLRENGPYSSAQSARWPWDDDEPLKSFTYALFE
jgi:hypothetical protein